MKRVKYQLLDRMMPIVALIFFSAVFIKVYNPTSVSEFLFSSIFLVAYIIFSAFIITLIAYFLYWRIDFDNEQFIFYTIFRKPLMIKYSDIEKIDIKYINTKNGVCDKLTFQLKNTNIQPYIFLLENAENYEDFLSFLKTE
ncbi:MAG: hypothetical protein K2K91_10100 [Ruminococcus sp.]|nr:hypothetical protein [Ruminococcus sp.]